MLRRSFKPGDKVVYRKRKHTTHPGRRAKQVQPAAKGDDYVYVVDKFWLVRQVLDNDRLLLETRRGKTHEVSQTDPNLRHATLWDRICHPGRLAELEQLGSNTD